MTPTLQAQIEEGKRRAQARFASLSQEDQVRVQAMIDGIPDRFAHTFISPGNDKGRQTAFVATDEEIEEWKQINA